MLAKSNYRTETFKRINGYTSSLTDIDTSGTKYINMLHDTLIVMQFYYHGPYKAMPHVDTFERHDVLIKTKHAYFHLYLDEDAYLFPHKISEISVGQLNINHGIWDGTAKIDIRYLQYEHPFVSWNA